MITAEFNYEECRYNPRKNGFVKDIESNIPQFANYEGHDGEERNNLFAYIVALYDKNSPLWAAEPEFFKRKIRAAQTCNMPKSATKSGGFAQWVREVMEGTDNEVNALIIAYLADMGNIDYMMLIGEITMFHTAMMSVVGGGGKNGLHKDMMVLSDNIKSRTRMLFGSGEKEELQRVRVALYEQAEKDRRKLNPESIVKMLDEEGGFPNDFSPYEKGYEVEELKYHQDES